MFESPYSGYDLQLVTMQSGQNGPFTFDLNVPWHLFMVRYLMKTINWFRFQAGAVLKIQALMMNWNLMF